MAKNGMMGENGMSPRKSMAMGKTSMGGHETFGVTPGLYNAGEHPDRKMSHAAMDDGVRGIGASVRYSDKHLPAQAAPDHGPHHIRGMKGK